MLISLHSPALDEPGGEALEGQPTPSGPEASPRKRRRLGATAMEYLVVASFILMVLIAAVQYLGVNLNKMFESDAAATSKTNNP